MIRIHLEQPCEGLGTDFAVQQGHGEMMNDMWQAESSGFQLRMSGVVERPRDLLCEVK